MSRSTVRVLLGPVLSIVTCGSETHTQVTAVIGCLILIFTQSSNTAFQVLLANDFWTVL